MEVFYTIQSFFMQHTFAIIASVLGFAVAVWWMYRCVIELKNDF